MDPVTELKTIVGAAMPEEDRERAKDVAGIMARLLARKLQGQDVDEDIEWARVAASSLGAAAKVRAESAILEGLGRVMNGILRGVLIP